MITFLRLTTAYIILFATVGLNAHAQDTLLIENFEGASSAFTLNTADVNSTTTGYNSWVINNAYTGGNGSLICFGFPFTFIVPATPPQPAAVFQSPNSSYLHTVSSAAISSSISNCCFLSADGLCNFDENYFTSMTNDVSTVGYDSVNFSFWWLCAGGANSFGEVYYSIDGGTAWTLISAPAIYNNQSTWVQQNISLPAFAQQTTLRFGYRFVNQTATAASDPGFGVDDVLITGSTFTGIDNLQFTNFDLKVFPNPVTDEINIAGYTLQNNQPAVLKIYDVMGKEVFSQLINRTSQIVNLKSFTSGVYFVKLQTGAKVSRLKFIKQ